MGHEGSLILSCAAQVAPARRRTSATAWIRDANANDLLDSQSSGDGEKRNAATNGNNVTKVQASKLADGWLNVLISRELEKRPVNALLLAA
jgi:hypothetical protein